MRGELHDGGLLTITPISAYRTATEVALLQARSQDALAAFQYIHGWAGIVWRVR